MESYVILLVLISALLHSIWNFLLKESRRKLAFTYLFNFLIVFIYLPVFLSPLDSANIPKTGLLLIIISGLIHAIYFIALSKAYSHGHLSIVYPLARSAPLFVPIWAFIFIGESISPEGILGILLIILGIYILHLRGISRDSLLKPFHYVREKASVFALITALNVSFYSIVDKVGVSLINPVAYIYLMFLFTFIFLTPYVLLTNGNSIRVEWSVNKKRILLSSFLCLTSYLLILMAFQISKVNYIVALRQISIIISVLIGIICLGERHGKLRVIAAVVMFAGFFLVTIAD